MGAVLAMANSVMVDAGMKPSKEHRSQLRVMG